MIYLILSDIHANMEALEAVLAAAGRYDHALVLGDLVGYGADPNDVVERVRKLPSATFIRGNHDKVATRLASVEHFNYLARFTDTPLGLTHTAFQLRTSHLCIRQFLPTGLKLRADFGKITLGITYLSPECIKRQLKIHDLRLDNRLKLAAPGGAASYVKIVSELLSATFGAPPQ